MARFELAYWSQIGLLCQLSYIPGNNKIEGQLLQLALRQQNEQLNFLKENLSY